ncbi:DUF1523 family protein [Candidatus Woesearchaeota archaeon]|jgi:hypothetical protein|nr:DUF1523 family protein [Candidatus Woesearchaeota archaeon]MBT6519937.1 DUF1523 family protein [Candidatus Woesearchaeota archaeon]MBT7367862.1 DUF1523 family protein [Candidatus Woesearchaeota archaeon]
MVDVKKTLKTTAIVAGVAVVGLGLIGRHHFVRSDYKVKIVGTERVKDGDEEKYVVFTSDIESGVERSFENTDSLLELKYSSSDLQAKLSSAEKEGQVCDIKTYGFRIPFFSSYKNIVSADCYDLE